jgi:hypothetical protein
MVVPAPKAGESALRVLRVLTHPVEPERVHLVLAETLDIRLLHHLELIQGPLHGVDGQVQGSEDQIGPRPHVQRRDGALGTLLNLQDSILEQLPGLGEDLQVPSLLQDFGLEDFQRQVGKVHGVRGNRGAMERTGEGPHPSGGACSGPRRPSMRPSRS